MCKVLLIGNPNVGKTTLFNSLTKSSEHTGNFHGVTVEEKSKIIKVENKEYEIVDLPGMYSLNSFSYEEEVAKEMLLKTDAVKFLIVDASCLRRNLYLALQLKELGIKFKILINNLEFFEKNGNCLDVKQLALQLGVDVDVVNAKKIKPTKKLFKICKYEEKISYFNDFIKIFKQKYNFNCKQTAKVLNGDFEILNEEQIKVVKIYYNKLVQARYKHIDEILNKCLILKESYVYGESKSDRFLLNPFVMIIGFILVFLVSLYAIFFLLGPVISNDLSLIFENLIINPIVNFLYHTTDNIWLIEFFKNGVLSSVVTILTFLPQVCLLFMFLTILEDSGVISRMAYVLDDFLSPLGLNGKAVYIMLLGLGCNTMSAMASRNMNGKNLKIKTALINPYISCMARLPIFVLISSTFFGAKAYFVVSGLYILGFIIAVLMSFILNKTILPTKNSDLLLEFPPIRNIDLKHLLQVCKTNAVDFIKRIFSIVLCMGIIVWILTHTMFNLHYTENITNSILFFVANKISFIFAPIGLNNAGIVCALIVGIMAKELIVSTISICNNTSNTKMLTSSLLATTSVISFSVPTAVSFLIFTLIYCPCVSNLAVLKKETDKFYMWFSIISQFTVAYLISFVVYQALTRGIVYSLIVSFIIALIVVSVFFIIKKIKQRKCLMCGKCKL